LLSGNPAGLLQQSVVVDKTLFLPWAFLFGMLVATPCEAATPPATEAGFACSFVHGHRPGASPLQGLEPQVAIRHAVAPDWDLFLRASLALFPQDRGTDLLSVIAGAALVIDASTWSPAVLAGLGYQGSMLRGDLGPDGVVLAGFQVDRMVRPWFRVGLGAEVRLPMRLHSRLPWLAAGTLRFLWGPAAR